MKNIFWIKTIIASLFMGLANVVPGVSGGTMILVLGLYQEFVDAFSDLTRFRFEKKSVIFITLLFSGAFATIFLLSSVIQWSLELYWSYFMAIFIGLTLGGAPALFEKARSKDWKVVLLGVLGLVIMILVSFVLNPSGSTESFFLYFFGGILASSAMVLPGISGSYIMLILGIYLPIIAALSSFKSALLIGDLVMISQLLMKVIIPFSLGMLLGLVAISNLLKVLLKKYSLIMHAFLLGILIGSVFGLYPFKMPRLDKISKYAQTTDQGMVLKIASYGWSQKTNPDIWEELNRTRGEAKLSFEAMTEIEPATWERLKNEKALLLVSGKELDSKQRYDFLRAGGKLMVVPDFSFSWFRFTFVILLVVLGFYISFLISKLKEE